MLQQVIPMAPHEELSLWQWRPIVGLDLSARTIRLVIMETTEDGPLPMCPIHHSFRSKKAMREYLSAVALGDDALVAVSSSASDRHGIIDWLSAQARFTLDWHGHPLGASISLELEEQMELVELPGPYRIAYALAFLASYRLYAKHTAQKLSSLVGCMDEILNEFRVELARLSHALATNVPERN